MYEPMATPLPTPAIMAVSPYLNVNGRFVKLSERNGEVCWSRVHKQQGNEDERGHVEGGDVVEQPVVEVLVERQERPQHRRRDDGAANQVRDAVHADV
jgi:hypothetical protein